MSVEQYDVRAPRAGEFFRINPDPAYRTDVALMRNPDDGELYRIAPALVPEATKHIPDKIEHCTMFLAQNQDGELFLWPVEKPVPADHPVYQAMTDWISIRLQS
jgi:hypothetical protein